MRVRTSQSNPSLRRYRGLKSNSSTASRWDPNGPTGLPTREGSEACREDRFRTCVIDQKDASCAVEELGSKAPSLDRPSPAKAMGNAEVPPPPTTEKRGTRVPPPEGKRFAICGVQRIHAAHRIVVSRPGA
eukprot:scaffold995_cov358-Pavlova_lutheri.AAC.17